MSYNFKKSFLFLVVSIFFVQSFFIGCNTEVDSEVVIIDEEKPKTPEAKISKEYSISGIPAAWSETDVYAYAYDDNGNRVLIPVTVEDGVVTFKADETYTKCVLVSLPKGTDDAAYTANPASILNADCQKSEVIDLTKDNLAFVLAKSDYIGTWNSISDELILNEDGTYSLDIENNDSTDYAGTYVDTKTGLKASYSEKVEETDVQKEIVFTKKEADVLVGIINEKETYFVKASAETPNLSGTWTSSDETTTTIINNESEKIYVKNGETEIWGTIDQSGNMFILQDEESNILGTGVVSASGSAYIYNEATGSYEIYTRNGSATESDSTIPLKIFTVTYKSEFAKDDVKEITEGIVLELENPTYKGYRFDGWYTDEEKTTKAEAKYTISENLTFYAKWIQQGTVKFTSAQSEHDDVVVDLGTKITIPTPTKEKFDFDGWYDGETKVEVGDYTVTKDVTLVAKWTALYDVTFDSAGGSTVDSVTNVRAGTMITLPTAPTYNDYEFDCWTDGTSTYAPETEYTVNSDVTFTAKWTEVYTVNYIAESTTTITVRADSATVNFPINPEKEGYTFAGWSIENSEDTYFYGNSYEVTDDVTFVANWIKEPVTYSVSGLPTDGTWDSVIVYAWGAAGKENGNFVTANLNDGTVTFSSTEDYTNCIIVSTSESYDTLAAATAESTGNAYSEDLSFVDGEAIFELPKVTYTITEVVSWWGNESTQSYVKLSTDEGDNVLVEATYDSETATITFATDYEFDTCVVCRFASDVTPESADLTTYSESELPNRSVLLVFIDNTAQFAYDEKRQLTDTNTVYFRDEDSFQYNGSIYVYFTSSINDEIEELQVEMEACNSDNWYKATVDYDTYDTIRFSGTQDGSVVYTTTLIMEKNKPYYRRYSDKQKVDGAYVLGCATNTTDDPDDLD